MGPPRQGSPRRSSSPTLAKFPAPTPLPVQHSRSHSSRNASTSCSLNPDLNRTFELIQPFLLPRRTISIDLISGRTGHSILTGLAGVRQAGCAAEVNRGRGTSCRRGASQAPESITMAYGRPRLIPPATASRPRTGPGPDRCRHDGRTPTAVADVGRVRSPIGRSCRSGRAAGGSPRR